MIVFWPANTFKAALILLVCAEVSFNTSIASENDVPRELPLPEARVIAQKMGIEFHHALSMAYNGYVFSSQPEDPLKAEYWDRVHQRLHSIDPRYCYIKTPSGFFMPDNLGFCEKKEYVSSQCNPTGEFEEFGGIDIISGGNPSRFYWSSEDMRRAQLSATQRRQEDQEFGEFKYGHCLYPRPGAPNYGYDPNHPGPVVGSNSGGPGPITIPPETGTPGGVENGMCGDKVNACTSGVLHGHPPDTAIEHRWTCRHIQGVAGGVRCSKPRSEDGDDENLGRCGDTADTCSGGDLHSHPPDTDSEIIWTCRNRGETYTMSNGQERHSGEITCAASKTDGTIRAVDNGYTGNTEEEDKDDDDDGENGGGLP